eukprot:TRINITY_DN551_c0_g1_i1.p1 TRINITY_DN551_c0_g1~~TRINITY_DN551_c0_g1_i1.p1  ORF type:complete len:155 (-),score=16.02 TRINITY_DN551_c0_g1_i1:163-627(-)
MSRKRLLKELNDIKAKPPLGIEFYPVDDELTKWSAAVSGPEGTPFEGGVFFFGISFPQGYPFKPLVLEPTTRIYHPSFHQPIGGGKRFCYCNLPALEPEWSPAYSAAEIMTKVRDIIANPPTNACGDRTILDHYLNDRAGWHLKAVEWTRKYAM